MSGRALPEDACPDLSNREDSWVFPISKPATCDTILLHTQIARTITRPYQHCCSYDPAELKRDPKDLLSNGDKTFVRTMRGVVARSMLQPRLIFNYSSLLPGDIGSRIGMMFIPTPNEPDNAELHFIINGVDQGACAYSIPYKDQDLFAVIDVYGTTKEVRILQAYDSKLHRYSNFLINLLKTNTYIVGSLFYFEFQ